MSDFDQVPGREYTKILVARLSPQNRCLGPEGAWLVPALPGEEARLRLRGDNHVFVSLPDRASNVFGWVAEPPEKLTAEGLRATDSAASRQSAAGSSPVDAPVEWYAAYLDAIERHPAGTPLYCHWMEVKLPRAQSRRLRFSRVIFYEPRE